MGQSAPEWLDVSIDDVREALNRYAPIEGQTSPWLDLSKATVQIQENVGLAKRF